MADVNAACSSTSESANVSTASSSPSAPLMSLVADETYSHLKRYFLAGHQPLPHVCLTNRLLVQLKTLQTEGNKTSKDVSGWFDELFPAMSYPSCRLSGALDRLMKKAQNVHNSDADMEDFLNTPVDFDFVSASLASFGLRRGHLLKEIEWTPPACVETLTRETVVDIELFRVREKQPKVFTCVWVKKLSSRFASISDFDLKTSIHKMMEVYKMRMKNAKNEAEKLAAFLSAPFSSTNGCTSEDDSRGGHGQVCCLLDNGERCQNQAGNASYSKRIQKTVQQRKLKLVRDDSVAHIYICDYHKNIIQRVRTKRRRKESVDGRGSPDADEEYPEIDFLQIPVNTLRRYKRHFKISNRPGLNKSQLAEVVSKHFHTLPVNEKETTTYFFYMAKNYKNRLDQKGADVGTS